MAKNGNFRLLLFRSHKQINWEIYPHPKQRHLVAKNGNFILLLLQVIQADQLADVPPPVEASSGQECQFQISFLAGHIGRSTGRSTLCDRGIQWPRLAILGYYCYRSHRQINWQMYPYPKYRHLMTKNSNFRLLLLQVKQADQLADVPPPVETSSGQECQFQISFLAGHIGRSTGRSTLSGRGIQWPTQAISDSYCYRSHRQIN